MNRWIFMSLCGALLSGTAVAPAKADEATTQALLACADEADDARRLRCFDAAVASLRKAPLVPAAAAAATPRAPAPAASPPTTSVPAPAASASAEDKFGARGDLKPDRHEQLSEITGTVTAVSTRPYGELVVTLDNGQVWSEIASNSRMKVKTGDTVRIEAGALGSFRLIAPNGRSSKVTRAR